MRTFMLMMCLLERYFTALCIPHAPVNVTVWSVNFEHILQWDPGPELSPETIYRVNYSDKRKEHLTNVTKMNLTDYLTDIYKEYTISVQALSNGKTSAPTFKAFTPFLDTALGPPKLIVTDCGGCLRLGIEFPRGLAKSTIKDIYKTLTFHIFYKKSGQQKVTDYVTNKLNNTIENLERGTEYCVQVSLQHNINPVLASGWICQLTGFATPNSAPGYLAVLAFVLCIGGIIITGLVYTRFLMVHYPRVLASLVETNFVEVLAVLDPVPDSVTVRCDPGGKKNRTTEGLQLFNRISNKEEERNGYENRCFTNFNEETRTQEDEAVCLPALLQNEDRFDTPVLGFQGDTQETVPLLEVTISGVSESHGEAPTDKSPPSSDKHESNDCESAEPCVDVNLLSVTLGALEGSAGEENKEGMDSFLGAVERSSFSTGVHRLQSLMGLRTPAVETGRVRVETHAGDFQQAYSKCAQEEEEEHISEKEEAYNENYSSYMQR